MSTLRLIIKIIIILSGFHFTSPEFVCIKVGYFVAPEPRDCTKFYRCAEFTEIIQEEIIPDINYNSTNFSFREETKLVQFLFDCPPGTIFDETLGVCNHPEETRLRNPLCKDQDSDQEAETPQPFDTDGNTPENYDEEEEEENKPKIPNLPSQPPLECSKFWNFAERSFFKKCTFWFGPSLPQLGVPGEFDPSYAELWAPCLKEDVTQNSEGITNILEDEGQGSDARTVKFVKNNLASSPEGTKPQMLIHAQFNDSIRELRLPFTWVAFFHFNLMDCFRGKLWELGRLHEGQCAVWIGGSKDQLGVQSCNFTGTGKQFQFSRIKGEMMSILH